MKEAILLSVAREVTLNLDGALGAIEMAQGLNLHAFSSYEALELIASRMNKSGDSILAFLNNAVASLSGQCQLNWGNCAQWHSLVGALVIPARSFKYSLLEHTHLIALQNKPAGNYPESVSACAFALCDTPPLAMLMFIRWLRIDILDIEKSLKSMIQSRELTKP